MMKVVVVVVVVIDGLFEGVTRKKSESGERETAIVGRASSGILRETARVLALRGVHVTMAVRNMAAGKDVKEEIVKEIAGGKVDVMESDLCSMASIRKFALEFNTKSLPLNLLVYSIFGAYGQSKLANILHANELAKRLKEDNVNITANSLHPGVIDTNLFRYNGIINCFTQKLGRYEFKNVQQGAATTGFVALHPQVKGISGEYFSDSNLAKTDAQARNVDLAKKLWDFSMDLIK
ncbi:hypothetical protein QYF36_019331 [Acer negundo]|nr:hypothetical protein QYF36_019331 [Acer negundo]